MFSLIISSRNLFANSFNTFFLGRAVSDVGDISDFCVGDVSDIVVGEVSDSGTEEGFDPGVVLASPKTKSSCKVFE